MKRPSEHDRQVREFVRHARRAGLDMRCGDFGELLDFETRREWTAFYSGWTACRRDGRKYRGGRA